MAGGSSGRSMLTMSTTRNTAKLWEERKTWGHQWTSSDRALGWIKTAFELSSEQCFQAPPSPDSPNDRKMWTPFPQELRCLLHGVSPKYLCSLCLVLNTYGNFEFHPIKYVFTFLQKCYLPTTKFQQSWSSGPEALHRHLMLVRRQLLLWV